MRHYVIGLEIYLLGKMSTPVRWVRGCVPS
jgi:hypothetical protein